MAITLWNTASSNKPTTQNSSSGGIQKWTDNPAPAAPPKPKKLTKSDYDRQDKLAADTQAKAKQKALADKDKNKSFLTKTKDIIVDTAKSVRDTGYKAVNTANAGKESVVGVAKAGLQTAVGDNQGAKKTLFNTVKTRDQILDKGLGGKGGYVSSKQATSHGDGLKGLQENYVKPTVKASAEIAPLVVPAGRTAKGATLLAKIVRGAADNAVLGAGANAATQAVDTGKVDWNQTKKAAIESGIIGGVFPVAGAAGKKLLPKSTPEARTAVLKDVSKGQKPSDIIANQKAVDALEPPRPGDIVAPAPKPHAAPRIEGEQATKPIAPTPDHVKAVDDLITQAKTEHPVFQQNMSSVARDLGLKYSGGPVKSADRTLTKVMEDYGGDHTRVKDTVRGTMEVPDHSAAGFRKVVEKIKEKYPDVEIKNGYKDYKNGYVDMKVTVRTPNGHRAEIILATPEMLEAKNKLGGHELYEIARDTTKTPAQRKAAAEQMHILYNNAHDSANKRLASSSESPSDLKTLSASASDKGVEPSRTTPTSLDEPVSTTVSRSKPEGNSRTDSTTSSADKNSLRESSIPSTVAEKKPEVKHEPNNSRVYERLQAEHPGLDGKVQYTPIRLKEEADKAAKLIESDKQKAFRVAMGAEPTDEITSTAVNIAMAEKALQDGNMKLYAQLTKNRSLAQTRRGQEIVSEKGSVTDNSTSRYVKELVATRLAKLDKNSLDGLEVGNKTFGKGKSKGIAAIDREVAKAQKRLQNKTIDINDAQSILDRITC